MSRGKENGDNSLEKLRLNWEWSGFRCTSPKCPFRSNLIFLSFLLPFLYDGVLLQGVVETLDRENDWLEMSEEGARVKTFYNLDIFVSFCLDNYLAFSDHENMHFLLHF